jgi:hypothetical protein
VPGGRATSIYLCRAREKEMTVTKISGLIALILFGSPLTVGQQTTPAVKQVHHCPSGESWYDEGGFCAANYSSMIQEQEADRKAHAGYYEEPAVKHPPTPKHFKAPATPATAPRHKDIPAVPAVATTTSDSSQSDATFWAVLLIAFYFLPSIAGYWSKKRNAGAIFALNLFLGWTVIGWIIAVIWACTKDAPEPVSEETMQEYLRELRKKT